MTDVQTAERLREQLASCSQTKGFNRYPAQLRQEAVRYARSRRRQGVRPNTIAVELGIDSSARRTDRGRDDRKDPRTMQRMSTALRAFRALALAFWLVVPAACQATTRSSMPFIEVSPDDIRGKDMALIYVYRVPDLAGSAGPWAVRLDGQLVALLKQNAYLVLVVRPGRHRVVLGDKPDSYTGSVGKNPLGQGLDMAADGIFARAADQGTFDTVDGGVYFLRMEGFDIAAVSRDDAMQELVRMRYDTGL